MASRRAVLGALPIAAVVAVVLVLVIINVGRSTVPAPTPSTATTDVTTAAAGNGCAATGEVTAEAPFVFGDERVDVIGDSYSVGEGLPDPRTQAWDVYAALKLHWRMTVHAVGGTGFVAAGPCGDQNYQTRIAAVLRDDPDTIVLQGGLNDVGQGVVAAAALQILQSIPPRVNVIVIGPPPAPALPLAEEKAVDHALYGAVGIAPRRTYISAIGWQLPYQPGGLHLSVKGNLLFADKVAAAIRAGRAASR